MIPKIIHYVWLGNKPIPESMQQCMDSWKKILPDYEWMCWNDESIKQIDSVFIREAIDENKWAFASDVVRLYAIYHYGGIYLDTDVKVYKSFDPLLNHHAFIGRENSMHIIGKSTVNHLTTYCFGAEKGNAFIERCLRYYDNRHFVTSDDKSLPMALRLDLRTNSSIFCELARTIGYNPSVLANHMQTCQDEVLTIYPSWCFDAVKCKPDTFSKHMALGTWRESPPKEFKYTLLYKIKWRLRFILEWILKRFDYILIKLK